MLKITNYQLSISNFQTMRKIIIFVLIIIGFAFLAGCVIQNNTPKIAINPAFYDFGEVVQSEGKVSTNFTVKNIGGAPLKFNKLSTSCGCTVAEMDLSDLLAGESRNMKVTFDPMVHPDQLGAATRVVYLQTNDPAAQETEIELNMKIIK